MWKRKIAWIIYSVGGVGTSPLAPGTAGSAVAGLLLLLPGRLGGLPGWEHPAWGLAVVSLFLAGVWSSREAERVHGDDPGVVVIDEVVGMLITLYLLPNRVLLVIAGFFLFRFFDIVKPWPAARLERVAGSWGVMLDDVAAGIYAHLVLRVAVFLLAGRSP